MNGREFLQMMMSRPEDGNVIEGYEPEVEEVEHRGYRYFDDPRARKELYEYSKSVAEYLRTEKVPNLVIIDRSSRPLYIGVREYWRSRHQDEPMPNMYFMNPKGFKARESLTEQDVEDIKEDCLWKSDAVESGDQVRTQDEILAEFQATYKRLIADKDQAVLVFDSCIHSGDTLSPVKETMEQVGFSDLRIGSVNPSDRGASVKTDFFITRDEPEKGCYPFDKDRMIEKTFDHVYARPTEDRARRRKALELRREIKRVIVEEMGKDIVNRAP